MAEQMQEIRIKGKAARIRGATWTHDQVKKLLEIWKSPNIYQGLLHEKKKQDVFRSMADALSRSGVNRSWTECRAKIKNLKADFRKAIEGKLSFRYYEEMRTIMNMDGSGSTDMQKDVQHEKSDETSGGCDVDNSGNVDIDEERSNDQQRFSTEIDETNQTSPYNDQEEYISASPYHQSSPYSTSSHKEKCVSPSVITNEHEHHRQNTEEDDNDDFNSNSRSSIVIKHVVSNVIEPVTRVIMPSTSSSYNDGVPSNCKHHTNFEEQPPPIRLEFVLENENLVLQEPGAGFEGQPDTTSETPEPALTDILKERLTKTVTRSQRHAQQSRKVADSITRRENSTPLVVPKRKLFSPRGSSTSGEMTKQKKREMLEALNKRTVETISNLLNESSKFLLKDLQEAEQRFILWEEDKRREEMKRDEIMFGKLIGAIQSSYGDGNKNGQQSHSKGPSCSTNSPNGNLMSVSRQLNEMVTEEIKATEEKVRDWESKMQRQENRHTEKLFAMIINAIKIPSTVD